MTFPIVDEFMSEAASIASPGSEGISWLRPVRPGDTLFATTEIVETRRSNNKPDRGLVKALHTVTNQNDETVMTMFGLGLFRCRTLAG